jgi:hypothetical protein
MYCDTVKENRRRNEHENKKLRLKINYLHPHAYTSQKI